MNVKLTSNNSRIGFKGLNQITIPRSAFGTMDETMVEDCFNKMFNDAIQRKPKKIFTKLLSKLFRTSEAVTFFNYPGYSNIQKDLNQRGETWFKSHVRMRYGLDIDLPESYNNYNFFILTKKEKKEYLRAELYIDNQAKDFANDVSWEVGQSGPEVDDKEYNFLFRLGKSDIVRQVLEIMPKSNYYANDISLLPRMLDHILIKNN